ncbi:hypothetical protein B0H14DRAFT_184584 [Mycena olivaceomarginata]|nr:hypothetical protein B0H14DRAFT_184584 [Mycena olivaceomarginata]
MDFGRLAKQHVPSHCLQSPGDLSPWNELGLGLLATQPAYSSAVFLCVQDSSGEEQLRESGLNESCGPGTSSLELFHNFICSMPRTACALYPCKWHPQRSMRCRFRPVLNSLFPPSSLPSSGPNHFLTAFGSVRFMHVRRLQQMPNADCQPVLTPPRDSSNSR